MEIKHPEWLQLEANQQKVYGYDQKWYKTSFQRTRGCGPTAAAMLLLYLNQREQTALPYRHDSIATIISVLQDVWDFVTPGWLLGLNSTKKFCTGMALLFKEYGLDWRCHTLPIMARRSKRSSLLQVVSFLEQGLAADCPIAFLNLHNGQVTTFDSWHWSVLVALSYDADQKRYIATCYDSGRSIKFDLGLWLDTSKFGGGFVYVETVGSKRD